MNPVNPFTTEELAEMVWLKTGRNPVHVRTQALHVIAEFEGGQTGVWRVEDLMVSSAMTLKWPVRQYLEAEEKLA